MRVHVLNHTRDGMVVHRAGCADVARAKKRPIDVASDWVLDVPAGKTISEVVVADLNDSFGWSEGDEEPQPWHESDLVLMPCCKSVTREPVTGSVTSKETTMANKNRNRAAQKPNTKPQPKNPVDSKPTNAVESPSKTSGAVETVPATVAAQPTTGETKMVALTLIKVRKNGSFTYGIPGVTGTVRIAKQLFPNGAPQQLEVNSEGFAQPDPAKAEKLAKRAERKAKLEATRGERAAKAQERAKKAAERATKLAERAAKLAAKASEAPKDQPAA